MFNRFDRMTRIEQRGSGDAWWVCRYAGFVELKANAPYETQGPFASQGEAIRSLSAPSEPIALDAVQDEI